MNLVLGAVDCIHPYLALKALLRSQSELGDVKAKLFTHVDIEVPLSIEVVKIEELKSGEAVSKWMLLEYAKYIREDQHLLNIQADGFVVNGDSWTDEFLDYDYIGAPWKLHPHHEWPPFPNVTVENQIGNGGFSLRSHKLMSVVSKIFYLALESKQVANSLEYHPEDCWICRTQGAKLRKMGLKFAPYELATKFSVENGPIKSQLGFHGKETMNMNPNRTEL
jgi:hypothetical protein